MLWYWAIIFFWVPYLGEAQLHWAVCTPQGPTLTGGYDTGWISVMVNPILLSCVKSLYTHSVHQYRLLHYREQKTMKLVGYPWSWIQLYWACVIRDFHIIVGVCPANPHLRGWFRNHLHVTTRDRCHTHIESAFVRQIVHYCTLYAECLGWCHLPCLYVMHIVFI
jgi:hypothetical protein